MGVINTVLNLDSTKLGKTGKSCTEYILRILLDVGSFSFPYATSGLAYITPIVCSKIVAQAINKSGAFLKSS